MEILCYGLSHHTAPVELRERFAVAQHQVGTTALQLSGMGALSEAVVLSTCNRVEFYVAASRADAGFRDIEQFVTARAGFLPERIHFYRHHSPDSINHLFRVVCGLDSMVPGESEILGQVKFAYRAASNAGATARMLNKLFQRAFNVAKEIRTRTSIARGSVSVGSVAVDLAQRIFGELDSCAVMVLGTGDTGSQTARALVSRGVKTLFVSNRSYEPAAGLAAELGGKALPFSQWQDHHSAIDILITSTASQSPIVNKHQLAPIMRCRASRPLFIIDLAVPRDVNPDVNEIEGVFLYDIDSLQDIAQRSLEMRRGEAAICAQMIGRHVDDFSRWMKLIAPQQTRGTNVPLDSPALRIS
jgi:glutamyl-tRNA reductase